MAKHSLVWRRLVLIPFIRFFAVSSIWRWESDYESDNSSGDYWSLIALIVTASAKLDFIYVASVKWAGCYGSGFLFSLVFISFLPFFLFSLWVSLSFSLFFFSVCLTGPDRRWGGDRFHTGEEGKNVFVNFHITDGQSDSHAHLFWGLYFFHYLFEKINVHLRQHPCAILFLFFLLLPNILHSIYICSLLPSQCC